MMSISKKSKVAEIKTAISNLGFKAPNLKKDDLLLYYEGSFTTMVVKFYVKQRFT